MGGRRYTNWVGFGGSTARLRASTGGVLAARHPLGQRGRTGRRQGVQLPLLVYCACVFARESGWGLPPVPRQTVRQPVTSTCLCAVIPFGRMSVPMWAAMAASLHGCR